MWLFNTQVVLNSPLNFLIGQSISTIFMLLICKKFDIRQLLYIIQKNNTTKLILISLSLIFIVVLFIINFEYDILFLLFSIAILLVFGLPMLSVLLKLYHNEQKVIFLHDVKNKLLSLFTVTKDVDDAKVIKQHLESTAKEFDIDLNQLDHDKLKENVKNREILTNRVKDFIELKKKQKGKNIEIFENIRYSKDYEHVNLMLMLSWLGTLLDNAIEATHSNPIYITIGASYSFLYLSISNEYIGNKGQDIKKILEYGYSTKGEGRGVGLHLLNTQVKEKGGEIVLKEYYEPECNCHYLQILVVFDDEDISLILK